MSAYRHDEKWLAEIERTVEEIRTRRMDGGYGSGNWGHLGRKGVRGGSAPGGGKQNRRELQSPGAGRGSYKNVKFTSFSKQRDAVAVKHQMSQQEFDNIPRGSVIMSEGRKFIKGSSSKYLTSTDGSKRISVKSLSQRSDTRIAVPKNSNTNVQRNPATSLEERRTRMENYPKHITDAQADKRVRQAAGTAYQKMSQDEKAALAAYNSNARGAMNRKMDAGGQGGAFSKEIQDAKSAVNRTVLENDIRMDEPMTARSFQKRFGVSADQYRAATSAERAGDVLAGYEGAKRGFTTGRIGGAATSNKAVVVHRNVKAGMAGIGVEAFSPTGNGAGPSWDGKSGQSTYSKRNEVVLGTGTREVITRSWVEGNTLHVETDVVAQSLN